MQVAPRPMRLVGAEAAFEIVHGLFQRLGEQFVQLRSRLQGGKDGAGIGAGQRQYFGREFRTESRGPEFIEECQAGIGRYVAVPIREFGFDVGAGAVKGRMPGVQELDKVLSDQGDGVLLKFFEVGNIELAAMREDICDALGAFGRSPVVSELMRVALGQDVVVCRDDEVTRRVIGGRVVGGIEIAGPLVLACIAGDREESLPAFANGGETV